MPSVKRGLLVGIPFSGRRLVHEWAWTFGQIRWPMNVDLRFERAENMEVAEARNYLAQWAVDYRCRWLFFLDEDTVPPLNAVKMLIEAMDSHPEAAMISGVYTDKDDPAQPMVFNEAGNGPFWDWSIGDVFKVGFGAATGCSLVNVPLLDQIPQPWFRTVEAPAERWTEDMWFCNQARSAGFSIYVHGGVLCRHYDLNTGKMYFLPPGSKPYRKLYNNPEPKEAVTC